MWKIIQMLVIVILLNCCMAGDFRKYTVYYVPLEIDFFVPPSRENIMKGGARFEIQSSVLDAMYEAINEQKNEEILTFDDCSLIRVLIINNAGKEVFITQDKIIVSIQDNKKYIFNSSKIDEILRVITVIGDDLYEKKVEFFKKVVFSIQKVL